MEAIRHVQDFSRAIHTVIYDRNRNASREIFNIGSNDNNITKKDGKKIN